MSPFSSFSEASSAVQRRSFLASAAVAVLTAQTVAVLLDGPYGLLYSVPMTVIAVVVAHHVLGQPLKRRADSDAKHIAESRAFVFVFVLLGLGAVPAAWATAGWPGAAGVLLVVVAIAAVLRAAHPRA